MDIDPNPTVGYATKSVRPGHPIPYKELPDVLQYATDDPKFQEKLSTLDPNQSFAKRMAIHEKNKKAL